jgi:uncharacterized protein
MTELEGLRASVLWLGFGLAVGLGFVAQRSHFCVMGAVADVVTMGDWGRARMWALALAVAVLGFAALQALGWVQVQQTLYGGARLLWASHLTGGLLFGFGMVLASGCGAKTLVRLGAGNFKSLVVLISMGLGAFMTLKGVTAVVRDVTVDPFFVLLSSSQDLPSLLGLRGLPWLVAALLLGCALRGPRGTGFWLGGVGTGVLVVAAWALTSRLGFVPEHPETLEAAWLGTSFNRPESFSFVAPAAALLDWLMFFSDRSKQLGFGGVSLLGVVAGAALSAHFNGDFRWEGFRQTEDLVNHLVGGALMGVGGITALGCTFGQGLSGLSTLSLGSVLSVLGIVLGAVVALRYQQWRAERG